MKRPLLSSIFVLVLATPASANIVWPAMVVADSFFRVWYVVALGILLEAAVLYRVVERAKGKALLVSIGANALSAAVGTVFLAVGMLAWHGLTDGFLQEVNHIVTFFLMFAGSVALEAVFLAIALKMPFLRAALFMGIGNVLSYAMVVVELTYLGGANRTY